MAVSTGSTALYSDLTNWYEVFNNLSKNYSSGISSLTVPGNFSKISASNVNNLNNKIKEFQSDYWLGTRSTWWPSGTDKTVGKVITPADVSNILTVLNNAPKVVCRNVANNSSGICQNTSHQNVLKSCGQHNTSACSNGQKTCGYHTNGTDWNASNNCGLKSNGTNLIVAELPCPNTNKACGTKGSGTCTSGIYGYGTLSNAIKNCGTCTSGPKTSGYKQNGTDTFGNKSNGTGYPGACPSGCPQTTKTSGKNTKTCYSGSNSCGYNSNGTNSSKYNIPCSSSSKSCGTNSSGFYTSGTHNCGTNVRHCNHGTCEYGTNTSSYTIPCSSGDCTCGTYDNACTYGTKQNTYHVSGIKSCGTNTNTSIIDITCVQGTKANG